MRKEIFGVLGVLALLLALVSGCQGDAAGPVLHVSPLTDTGVKYPGTVTTVRLPPWDNEEWTNPGNVRADDAVYASVSFGPGSNRYTHVLRATNFSCNVPAGATINGIKVEIERHANNAGWVRDDLVQLTKDGAIRVGIDKADKVTWWPTSLATKVYGNETDRWGATWTAAEVNASTFGVHFAAVKPDSGANHNCSVDFIRITVYYTPVAAPTVTEISPSAGCTAGGTSVTITGTNFVSGANVTIGGSLATGVTVVNSTTITAITPAGTVGAKDVVVTTVGGSGTLPNGYTYVAPPVADFSANTTSGCAPLSVLFTDTSTGNRTGWSWSFPGGSPSSATGPGPHTVTYSNPGTYSVSLNVSNACGWDDETKTNFITVTAAPVANFSANATSGCAPLSVLFTDTSTGSPTNYSWSFPGGSPASANTQGPHTVTYNTTGSYNVTLTVSNVCGSNTTTRIEYIRVQACTTYYKDADGDTWGVDGDTRCLCAPSGNYTATRGGDCDDTRSAVNPGATETCDDLLDNDCDGDVDCDDAICSDHCRPGTGIIGGRVFYDADRDGERDEDEDGIGNVTVRLYWSDDCEGGQPIGNTTTGEDGTYGFGNLTLDRCYCVKVDEETLPDRLTLPVNPMNSICLDEENRYYYGALFAGQPLTPPSVGLTVYPINKLAVLVPWIALAAAVAAGIMLVARRRRAHT